MRKLGYVQSAIWSAESEFRRLSVQAQHVYLLLLSQPDVTSCGTIAYTPKRWASFSAKQSSKNIQKAVRELDDHRFVVLDEDTEELLIRTFFKHNKVAEQPKMMKNAAEVYGSIASEAIRRSLADENPSVFAQPSSPDTPTETPNDSLSGVYPLTRTGALVEDLDLDRDKKEHLSSVEVVWAEYASFHPHAVYTTDRKNLIKRRLNDYPAETLIEAIRGNHSDPWCNGENQAGKQYHDLALIFRDAGKIEQYASQSSPKNGKRSWEQIEAEAAALGWISAEEAS